MNLLSAAGPSGIRRIIVADLVVLDGDYMTVPEADIGELPVVMTVGGGKVVHEVKPAAR